MKSDIIKSFDITHPKSHERQWSLPVFPSLLCGQHQPVGLHNAVKNMGRSISSWWLNPPLKTKCSCEVAIIHPELCIYSTCKKNESCIGWNLVTLGMEIVVISLQSNSETSMCGLPEIVSPSSRSLCIRIFSSNYSMENDLENHYGNLTHSKGKSLWHLRWGHPTTNRVPRILFH